MLVANKTINDAWLAPRKELNIKIKIDGVVYDKSDVTSLSFDSASIVGDSFQIGSAHMNQIQVEFPSIIESIAQDLEVTAELGIFVDGAFHYSKLGTFLISEFDRNRNERKTTFTAVDKMVLLEGSYVSKLSYPTSIRNVALEIANLAGVVIDQLSFSALPTTTIAKPEGYTYRQAIGLIAQFVGGFANFNREGKLQVRALVPTDFTLTTAHYMMNGFAKNESTYRVNGIRVITGDEESNVLSVGTDKGNVIQLENKVMTQALLNTIWQKVQGVNYFPFELKWFGNPNLEAGDWINIVDHDGVQYSVPNLAYSFTYNGGMRAESKATTTASSEVSYRYKGSLTQKIIEIEKVLTAANGWNSNYYDQTEPPLHPKEGDAWFKPNGAYTEIWLYKNVEGVLKWVLEISDAPNEAIQEAIEQMEQDIIDANEKAQAGLDKAEEAISKANFLNDAVDIAVEQSADAVTRAQQAQQSANDLLGQVTEIEGTLTTVESVVDELNGQMAFKVNTTEFNQLTGIVDSHTTKIGINAGQIAIKANKDYVDTINNQVESVQTELTVQAGEILGLSTSTNGLITEVGLLQSSFDTFRVTLGEVQTEVNGAVKSTVVEYYLSTSLTTATDGSWVTTAPPWTAGKYMWSRTKIVYVNGNISYSTATCIAGAQGQQGNTGNTGATGKSVSSIIPQYAMTTSKTTAPTTGWTTTAPTWIEGQYIWTRSQINWTNPTSTTYTTPVVDSALDAVATKYSDLQIKVDGIQSTVSRIDGDYATNTKVNQLADQWTQTTNLANGHTGQISNLGTQINLRLTQKQVLDEISKDKEVIDTRNTNERPQWYWDNYPRTVIKELKLCAVMGLPAEAGEFATVVTDTSWSRYGVGAVTQTAIVNSGQYQRKSTSGTVWDYWAKIADTSNVLAQINLSTEGILIQGKKIQITGETYIQNAVIKTAHIADLAVSGAKIANASISSAKIISLDASKITTNTLSAITTNTGDLNISGNLTMSTANSIISGSYDFKEDVGEAYNPRKFIGTSELVQRYMVFKGGIYTPTNTHLGYAETYFGLDFFKMRWYNSQSEKQLRGRIDMNHGQIEFGDTFGRPHTIIGSEDIYFGRGLSANRIYATADWPSFLINEHNTNGIMGIRLTNDNYGFGTFSKNNNLASINVGGDGKPRVWFERGVYDRTYSASANMFVTEAGTIGRAVSARKYKTDINKEKLENAKDILKIQPSSWLDKVEVSKGEIKQRYYGFIADEFHEIGLTEVVQYGIYGDVEGLDYDHITMYHNVILSDHEKEIIDLKQKVSELEKQVRVLQMAS